MLRTQGDPLEDCRALASAAATGQFAALFSAKRTPTLRRSRSHVVQVVSARLKALLAVALTGPDGRGLQARLVERQLLTQDAGDLAEPVDELERVILDLSDLLAQLKDPCHTSVWKDRRQRIARRPYSAMPLFKQPLTRDRDTRWLRDAATTVWVLLADRDLLEWVEEPFVDATIVDDAGEEHRMFLPATNGNGDITPRQLWRWLGLSRSVVYKMTERTKRVGTLRVPNDVAIPGLYVTPEGNAAVHLETYVNALLTRREAPSADPAGDEPGGDDRVIPAGDTVADPDAQPSTRRITPSEELLEYLEAIEAPDIERHRAELADAIAEERAAGEFIVVSLIDAMSERA